ncbi:MAG: acylphosphatase [Methanosarcinales archaeon]|nr:acylphosphatase [Methanosarcinales archaeon]
MLKRAVIIAKGDVQRVGYRDVVERVARKNNITGTVSNIEPYDVMIICEGDMKYIEPFINQIRIKKYPIEVEHLDITFEDATGEFTFFKIKRGDMTEELGERLDVANSKLIEMIGKQDIMIDKQDIMIDKQDIMIDKQDIMIDKQDTMIDLQKETIDTIKIEGEKTRETITTHISQEVADLRYEIEHVKLTLAKVVEKVGVSEQ